MQEEEEENEDANSGYHEQLFFFAFLLEIHQIFEFELYFTCFFHQFIYPMDLLFVRLLIALMVEKKNLFLIKSKNSHASFYFYSISISFFSFIRTNLTELPIIS